MEHSSKYARILVPTDGTEEAQCAVCLAGELASMLASSLDLLYVSPFDARTDEGHVAWLPDSVVRPAAEEARAIFTAAAARLPDGISHTQHHRTGAAADEILRFIDERGIGLLVIGGRKHSRVSGILLGSVTQTVLERSGCAVIVAGGI